MTNKDFTGNPFDLPEFYISPRVPTDDPVMPVEVYYNKITTDEDDLEPPEGEPELF